MPSQGTVPRSSPPIAHASSTIRPSVELVTTTSLTAMWRSPLSRTSSVGSSTVTYSPAKTRSRSRSRSSGRIDARKPDAAEVDADHRHAAPEQPRERAQHRPVAAEHDRRGRRSSGSSTSVTPARSATAATRATALSTSTWPCVTTARGLNRRRLPCRFVRRGHPEASGRRLCLRWRKNSRLPLGRVARSLRRRRPRPSTRALPRRPRAARARESPGRGRRRCPSRRPTAPASNCGFTSTTACQSGAASSRAGGKAVRTEMNETSHTTSCGANGSSVSARAFVRSSTTTRGSSRIFGCSCP